MAPHEPILGSSILQLPWTQKKDRERAAFYLR
jgi:hypothetical protein